MSETDIAWLAGVLEADGCFTVAYKNYPRIAFSCCDEDVTARVAAMLEGTITTRLTPKGNKTVWSTSKATRTKLIEILNKIFPYMGNRRKQRITELLNMINNPKVG